MNNKRVWKLNLTDSDLKDLYFNTKNPNLKRKIENHLLADRMSHHENWTEKQWDAVRKFYDAHGKYPESAWWDEEVKDWAWLGDDGEIRHGCGCVWAM